MFFENGISTPGAIGKNQHQSAFTILIGICIKPRMTVDWQHGKQARIFFMSHSDLFH